MKIKISSSARYRVYPLSKCKKNLSIVIYRQISEDYDNFMNKASVQKQCSVFDGKRTDVHNEESKALPSVVNDELKTKIACRAEK